MVAARSVRTCHSADTLNLAGDSVWAVWIPGFVLRCAAACNLRGYTSWKHMCRVTAGVIGGAISCSGFLICFALCCLTLITGIAVGAVIMHGMLPAVGFCRAGNLTTQSALNDPCN